MVDRSTPPDRRVVITGVGLVTPLGGDRDVLLDRLRSRVSGIRKFSQIPNDALPISAGAEATEFTGAIDDYGPMDKKLQRTIRKGSKVMCREIEMGVAVAQLALHDAGVTPDKIDPLRTGAIYGCDYIISLPEEYADGIKSCLVDGKFDFKRWGEHGKPKINPLWLLKYLPNMPASHVAIYNDLRGPNNSITIREASAGAAIAEAHSTIQRGHADVLVVGSTGSRIHPLRTLHAALQEDLASDRDDPAEMSRPFSADRDGAVVGEGAGAMILETLSHARQRGATIIGEVLGYGSSGVGANQSDFIETALANVYRAALGDAQPSEIGHLHAHGIGTTKGDAGEAAAITKVFGGVDSQPPVTTIKGHMGNLGGGGGMVEAIASMLSLGGELFPIANLDRAGEDCPINAVTTAGVAAGDQFISANVTPQGQATAVRIGRFAE